MASAETANPCFDDEHANPNVTYVCMLYLWSRDYTRDSDQTYLFVSTSLTRFEAHSSIVVLFLVSVCSQMIL